MWTRITGVKKAQKRQKGVLHRESGCQAPNGWSWRRWKGHERGRDVDGKEAEKKSERERTRGGRRSDGGMKSARGEGGIYVGESSAQQGFFPKRRFDPGRERKGLCFHRRLIEQRAPNCSIRLSRKSGPKKNEFSNSTKLFMTHLSKSTKKKEKKKPSMYSQVDQQTVCVKLTSE